jgi:Family of unknown function (DUF6058)
MDFTERDLAYVRANYVTLDQAVEEAIEQGVLPRPSYVLPDGTAMVPRDYFALVDVRPAFEQRYLAAGGTELDEDWEGYLSGLFGVCLRDVTPETMVRKEQLVKSLTALLENPQLEDDQWRERLRAEVDELDELEREFAPDYDRNLERFGKPPTRDLLIGAAHERFPELWAPASRAV